MDLEIIDNFLPEKEFEYLQKIMLGINFPWFFSNFCLSPNDKNQFKFQFVHNIFRYDLGQCSNAYPLFNKCENLLIPTTPELPFKLKNNLEDPLKMYLSDMFTVPINLAGIASLNIPAGFSSDNLPIGLQLVSNSFKEETLFSLAHILGEEEIFEAN